MKQAVMVSINPWWVRLIAEGRKTVEVRKKKPMLETPFKVYIYETKKGIGHGKVVGEFVCDGVVRIKWESFDIPGESDGYYSWIDADDEWVWELDRKACLTYAELVEYLGEKGGYGWHVSNLKMYDKPKSVTEFGVNRPPQSWRYILEA